MINKRKFKIPGYKGEYGNVVKYLYSCPKTGKYWLTNRLYILRITVKNHIQGIWFRRCTHDFFNNIYQNTNLLNTIYAKIFNKLLAEGLKYKNMN